MPEPLSDEELWEIEKRLRYGSFIDMYGHMQAHDTISKLLDEVRRLREENGNLF